LLVSLLNRIFIRTTVGNLDRGALPGNCPVDVVVRPASVGDLRRSAARNLIRSGVAQSVAMCITGHETDAMFRR